jgi:polyisoprenyl-phosphate glycosyltransferase
LKLCAERKARQTRLEPPKPAERPREDEQIVGPKNLKPSPAKKVPRAPRRERNRIPIELAPAHHEARGRTPRIVLPEGESPAWSEKLPDLIDDVPPLCRRDVVEDRAAIDGVERTGAFQIAGEHETDARSLLFSAGDLDEGGGLVSADDLIGPAQLRQKNRRRTGPAPEVEDRAGAFVQKMEAIAEPLDSAPGEIVLVLSREAEAVADQRVIALRVAIELACNWPGPGIALGWTRRRFQHSQEDTKGPCVQKPQRRRFVRTENPVKIHSELVLDEVLLSTVIPVYQGSAYLRDLVAALSEVRERFEATGAPVRLAEAIFVDDGSIDRSESILDELAREHDWISVISLSRNFGQHPATIAGILHASGDWIASLDEDLQHHPRHLAALLRHAVRNGSDIVYAKPEGAVHQARWRDVGSSGFKRLVSLITGNPFIRQFNSFRMMRGSIARAAASVCANDPYFDIAACWFTKRVGVLPLPLHDERFAVSKTSGYNFRSLLRHGARMMASSELKFLRFGAAVGALTLVASVVMSLVVIFLRFFRPETIEARGWVSLVLVTSFFGGLISFLAGIILELTTALSVRAKGKPTFFVIDRSRDALLFDWAQSGDP